MTKLIARIDPTNPQVRNLFCSDSPMKGRQEVNYGFTRTVEQDGVITYEAKVDYNTLGVPGIYSTLTATMLPDLLRLVRQHVACVDEDYAAMEDHDFDDVDAAERRALAGPYA